MCKVVTCQSKLFYDSCLNIINLKNDLNPNVNIKKNDNLSMERVSNLAFHQNSDPNIISSKIIFFNFKI